MNSLTFLAKLLVCMHEERNVPEYQECILHKNSCNYDLSVLACPPFSAGVSPPVGAASDFNIYRRGSVAMQEAHGHCICFGLFEFSPQANELRKRGLKVKISPLACRALALLLEQPGVIRTRDEFRARLWPPNIYLDFEQSLNKTMHALRAALQDSATSPRYIETVGGHGYRFLPIAELSIQKSSSRESQKIDSVAVLPFVVSHGAADCQWLAYQLTLQLTNTLARIPGVRVLAHSTVKHYNAQDKSPRFIGGELGVRSVIFGELLRNDGNLIFNIELVDVASGTQLWGEQIRQTDQQAVNHSERLLNQVLTHLRAILQQSSSKLVPIDSERPLGVPVILDNTRAKRYVNFFLA